MATIISLLFAGLNLINGILAIMLIIALKARFWAIALAFGSYLIIRECLYKFIHLMRYHPKPNKIILGSFGRAITLPTFIKNSPDYLSLYQQRSKKLQRHYFFCQLLFHLTVTPIVARFGFSLIRHLDDRQSPTPAIIVRIILILGPGLGTHYLAGSLTKWFLKYREAKVLLVKREQPILTGTTPNQQTLSDSKKS
ncbi:putative lipoprotein [Streptococcus acidominimus]|uniref:Putative lipoprotein n=1 Tax=Streptococcus acidominimus TaxID=1326 RepID=A0A239XI62_STRAI|nr:hypothetical protein [Streptococcus acidominimus]SNV46569.1 putative lipoprotein [Streptococcus acidominimus]